MLRSAIIITAIALIAGCGNSDQAQKNNADQQLALDGARMTVAEFSTDLKSELMSSMNDGGAVNAIEVCRIKAPEIAAAHSNDGVWAIKRVTDRYRNPDNAADQHESEILKQLADTSTEPVDIYTEWVAGPDGDSTFYYYQAIRTSQLCLNCHGAPDNLADGVGEKLAELYPEDHATGFGLNELRGMFVVSMKWPEAKKHAADLTTPQGHKKQEAEEL